MTKIWSASLDNVRSLVLGCLQQLFQAQFPQKFEHFNMKTMQSVQPASPLAGGLPPKSPEVEKLPGI